MDNLGVEAMKELEIILSELRLDIDRDVRVLAEGRNCHTGLLFLRRE